jgi:hypothetical protein
MSDRIKDLISAVVTSYKSMYPEEYVPKPVIPQNVVQKMVYKPAEAEKPIAKNNSKHSLTIDTEDDW